MKRQPRKHNPAAAALGRGAFNQRVVQDKRRRDTTKRARKELREAKGR